MDMSLIGGALAMQTASIQMQVAAKIAKSSMNADRDAVLTLLGAAQQGMAAAANLPQGVGGNLDIFA